MQGAWQTRASPSWSVTNSTCANDAEGPITKTRELEDGTTKFMSRKFLLSNRSMYLIGLISLHKEHLIMAQLRREVRKKLSILPSGACVDCLFYDAKHTASLRAVIALLRHPDGSMIWKLEDKKNAPHCGLENAKPAPTKSIWVDHTDEAHSASIYNFGDWSTEKRFARKREWRVETEPRGLGLFPGDDYQDMVSEALVQNGGGVVVGQGGSGKSEILKRVKILLEAAGWAVHVVAFTHVAAANCGGHTIMRELHSKIQAKRVAVLIDEMSMVSVAIWAALAQMKMTGSSFWVFGDCQGQFMPIQDQARVALLDNLETSDFLHSLCNGLRVEVKRYRRGTDEAHFNFVGQIYGTSLESALDAARERYPARGTAYAGTTLVVDHRCRVLVNEHCNRRLAGQEHILVKAGPPTRGCANLAQDMRIFKGIILIALGTAPPLRNGLRYKVVELPTADKDYMVQNVNDRGDLVGEVFSHCPSD